MKSRPKNRPALVEKRTTRLPNGMRKDAVRLSVEARPYFELQEEAAVDGQRLPCDIGSLLTSQKQDSRSDV